MKKYWFFLLVCILLFMAGCDKTAETQLIEETAKTTVETTLPPETTEETIPVPQTTCGTARVYNTPAILSTGMRGDQVDVVGEYDDSHYVIKTADGYGLVRREFIRMEGETSYETWTGYARWNAEFYTDLYLTSEPTQKLTTNTEVEVLDDLGYCYVVQLEEAVGFAKQEQISKWRISSGGSGDDEGGGGGGSGGGGGGGGGQDGGDISLRYHGSIQLLAAIEQTGEVIGTGTILADGTEVILGYFGRGEELPVVEEEGFAESKDGFCTIYLNGLYAWVRENLVCLEEPTEPFEEWDGYARWSATVYDNIHLIGTPKDKLNTNTEIHVVDELENCYLVEIEEVPGFMAKDMVSKWRISSGGSDDEGGGGGGGSGGGGSGAEWSPPAL